MIQLAKYLDQRSFN